VHLAPQTKIISNGKRNTAILKHSKLIFKFLTAKPSIFQSQANKFEYTQKAHRVQMLK